MSIKNSLACHSGWLKTRPFCFTAYNCRSIDQIGTKFRKNQSYFILGINIKPVGPLCFNLPYKQSGFFDFLNVFFSVQER